MKSFNHKRKRLSREPKILGSTILRNDNDSEFKVEAVITYESKYSLNWGSGSGVLKGLPTTIRFPNPEVPNTTLFESIKWGIVDVEDRNESAFK